MLSIRYRFQEYCFDINMYMALICRYIVINSTLYIIVPTTEIMKRPQ